MWNDSNIPESLRKTSVKTWLKISLNICPVYIWEFKYYISAQSFFFKDNKEYSECGFYLYKTQINKLVWISFFLYNKNLEI